MTYIPLPCAEKGQYLSLNFCSQEVTVSLITLKNRSFDLQARHFTIPDELLKKTSEQVFDFLAECIYDFTSDSNLNMTGLPMGITFGFPCEQRSLRSAILLEWTKNIECSGAVGNDVVVMLEKSLSKREDLDVKILALVSDTTETLLAAMWKVRKCKLAVVVDYGTNISYVERIECIPKFKGDKSKPCMIINLESGNMGCNGAMDFIRTQWDRDLDAKSQHPGRYLFDKMTGKEYMGELVRRVVMSAIHKRIIFRGNVSEEFSKPWSIDASKIVDISKDWSGQAATRTMLRSLGFVAPTAQECIDFKFVCQRVWLRSAHLSAAAIASVIQYMRCKQVGIGYSGSLLFDNPRFLDVLRSRLRQLLDPRIQFQFVLPEAVGGLGAALAACVANTGSIAMFTERLEEPENVFYNDSQTEDAKSRKSESGKNLKGLSDTNLQLTPKKTSREQTRDSILKKPNEPKKIPPKPSRRRSLVSLNRKNSKSNVDVIKKELVKSNSSKQVSKQGSESVSGETLSASKPQVRDLKPPAAATSSQQSIKLIPKPLSKRKDMDSASLQSAGQGSQKSVSSTVTNKEKLPHKVKSLPTNAPVSNLQPSLLSSDRAVSNIGASGSRKKYSKEPNRTAAGNEGARSQKRVDQSSRTSAEKIARVADAQSRRIGVNNASEMMTPLQQSRDESAPSTAVYRNRNETRPSEKAKTNVKSSATPSRGK